MDNISDFSVFLVDDDPFYLRIFSQHLQNIGIKELQTFSNGYDCLEHISDKPDIVFLDHLMGDIEGYEVLKKIKRYDPDIYVVIISSQSKITTAVNSLKHGAFDYLEKGDDEQKRISAVLHKIVEVKALLRRTKPGLLGKIMARL